MRPQGPSAPVNLPAQIEQLRAVEQWKLTGKMALRENDEAVSANLRWSVNEQDLAFRLSNFLGVTLVDLQAEHGLVTLKADDRTYTDTDATRLIYRVTGWDIPIGQLLNWVKGVPGDADSYTLTDAGLLATLSPACNRCQQWQVSYGNYMQVDNLWLPGALTLTQKDTSNFIKIRIHQWQIP
ncbi:lipoprotein insertase outer membrane protein LolB [Alteromonas sp. ASW11-19]|uniref:Outer-membrane lipoprotein LolB n=1 Tax=Alteromonas salexigens TaxID=2982530 RepID=A0ABT2VKR3_9ALTE|nr:lipoprotein insertase outer membrane protein LolB [Alteromonas salexigens]MCU7553834.1 lipoprotein insertase outer membrane protein LolB [Alteromonas salexigens]